MEQIGDIVSRMALNRQTGSEDRKVGTGSYTPDEARAAGIEMLTPPPPPDVCPFCGKENYRKGIAIGNTIQFWMPTQARCDCAASVEYWQKKDAEEKKAKENEERQEKLKRQQERIQRLIGDSGIKKRFQKRRFDNFITDTPARAKAYAVAKDYADNFDAYAAEGIGLYIEGTNGTGKTHLAAAIAMQLMTERNIPVICKTAGDMLSDIKTAFDKEDVTEKDVLGVYKDAALLVVDDLGKEQCTDWSISTLYSILNDRYEEMRPTIITTNYNSDDLERVLTPKGYDNKKVTAIISRLREVSKVLTMAWKDYRGG